MDKENGTNAQSTKIRRQWIVNCRYVEPVMFLTILSVSIFGKCSVAEIG